MNDTSRFLVMVEDSPADIALARAALNEQLEQHDFRTFGDGQEAYDYLCEAGNPLPDLVLLDLNLPRMDGRELLQRIKSDARLRSIPVVVLTTSNSPYDRADAYSAYANSFVTKPVDLDDYAQTLQNVVDYWLHTVTLPGPVN